MFKFNFSDTSENDNDNNAESLVIQLRESQEIQPNIEMLGSFFNKIPDNSSTFNYGNVEIRCIPSKIIIDEFREKSEKNSILFAETNHSDLVTGIYEGGLKIWECTHDLANYICDNDVMLLDKHVLDLGCGVGIIGILSLLKGSYCDFQDYNDEIINCVTIPNVLLNVKDKHSRCKFYSGDWGLFLNKILDGPEKKYDVIFTCETIYNCENYHKLLLLFKNLLRTDGVIYLAAKIYYFGVGGGLREFEDIIRREGIFDFSTCWKCSEGVQREIVLLKLKNQ